jgi:chemotaxis protein methyltransferase CheR
MGEWSDADLDVLLAYVRGRSGLTFPTARRDEVRATVQRAARGAGAGNPQGFLEVIDRDETAREDLIADLTIGETYFFRDPGQFELVRTTVVPALLRGREPSAPIRAWSAGCASGEEPYSVAILLHEMGLGERARILGTDISRPRLRAAQRARYTRWSLRSASASQEATYFRQHGKEFHLLPFIREMAEFGYLNLAEDSFPSLSTRVWGMDLVLCRNVLIYFDTGTVKRVARRLLDTLSEDGWLLLGASDPVIHEMLPCEVVVTDAGLAYRRSSEPASVSMATRPPPPAAPAEPPPARREEPGPEPGPEPQRPPAPEPVAAAAEPVDASAAVAAAYAQRAYDRAAALAAEAVGREAGAEVGVWAHWIRALANQGCLEEAGRVASRALRTHASSAELVYLHALLLHEAGRLAEAAEATRRALYLDRGLVVAHLLLGNVQARLGNPEAADRAYRNARELLLRLPADAVVPASDAETAGRLAELARVQIQLLQEAGG